MLSVWMLTWKPNRVGNTFNYLLQEEPETRLAIQEALSMMVGAYSTLEGAQKTLMEALVASYLIKVGSALNCSG